VILARLVVRNSAMSLWAAAGTTTRVERARCRRGALLVPLSQGLPPRLKARFAGGHACALFIEPHRVEVGDRRDPVIVEPTDAIVRVVLACVCGSDLWYYRGDSPFEPGPIGHEFVGVVEDVGRDVAKVKRGDFVIAPFASAMAPVRTAATASTSARTQSRRRGTQRLH
jgi:Alcohol dehydrogenase GroES-like domain